MLVMAGLMVAMALLVAHMISPVVSGGEEDTSHATSGPEELKHHQS